MFRKETRVLGQPTARLIEGPLHIVGEAIRMDQPIPRIEDVGPYVSRNGKEQGFLVREVMVDRTDGNPTGR